MASRTHQVYHIGLGKLSLPPINMILVPPVGGFR